MGARVVRSNHTGITLVEHELGRRLLPDFCLLCHLGSLIGRRHRGLLLLQLLVMLRLLGRVFAHARSAVPDVVAVLVVARATSTPTINTTNPTNESRDICLLMLSLLIFAALTAARELQLQVMLIAEPRGGRSCHTLDDAAVVACGVGEGWIGMLVTATVTVLPGRLSTIQVSYAADRSHICFPFHNDDDLI